MDRRIFTSMLPALLASGSLASAEGREMRAQAEPAGAAKSLPGKDAAPLTSRPMKPGPPYGSLPKRVSHRYVSGVLQNGHIALGMHETIQEVGAPHEPVDVQPHNEIFFIQRGVATLFINGTEHRLEAGDAGLVCAGDAHWVKNGGDTELSYLVVTLGPAA